MGRSQAVSYSGTYQGAYGTVMAGSQTPPPLNPFQFDTGIPAPLRSIVLDGLYDLLRRLLKSNGGYLADLVRSSTVVTGGHDENGVDLLFDLLQGQAPAIAVCVGDLPFKPGGDPFTTQGELDVHVYFLVNSLRSRITRLTGDVVSLANRTADPGCFVILEHARQLLIGQAPGGAATKGKIKPLVAVGEYQIGSSETFELWHQHYRTLLQHTADSKRDIDLELTSFRTYHQLADQVGIPTVLTTDTEV